MSTVARDAILLPLFDVGLRDVAVVLRIARAVHQVRELTESLDADDAFERQVRLEGQPTGKVVCADCLLLVS